METERSEYGPDSAHTKTGNHIIEHDGDSDIHTADIPNIPDVQQSREHESDSEHTDMDLDAEKDDETIHQHLTDFTDMVIEGYTQDDWYSIPVNTHKLILVEEGVYWREHQLAIPDQCFLFSRDIGQLTPKIIYFHYLKKSFLNQSIQKNVLFNFEKGSTVPDYAGLRKNCIEVSHDAPWSGYFGRDKTIELVKKHYWWPKMDQDIVDYVRRCDTCQSTKVPSRKPYGFIVPLSIPNRRLYSISMDFITRLPP